MTNVKAGVLLVTLPVQFANTEPAPGLAVMVYDFPSVNSCPLRLGLTVPLPLIWTTSGAVVEEVLFEPWTMIDPVMKEWTEQL